MIRNEDGLCVAEDYVMGKYFMLEITENQLSYDRQSKVSEEAALDGIQAIRAFLA